MAQAMENASDCAILIRNPLLTFVQGSYSYRIERRGNQSFYTVTSGKESLTLPIRFAVGSSVAVGQTYILEHEGEFYESRVSYFSELAGLDITIGHNSTTPSNLLEAAGRRLAVDEKLRCIGCHSTGAVRKRELILNELTPGVQCSHCHENAFVHLGEKLSGDAGTGTMKRLSTLSAGEISDFCGQCHRTWEEIALTGIRDITTLRFQPYRLQGSKCFNEDDPRISCIACHDPHVEVDKVAEHYDSRCLACHTAKSKPGLCRVAKKACTNCHMPKLELPGAHHKFADHRIRIVRPGETFPG
jgi:Cytochrome c554 and c-prime